MENKVKQIFDGFAEDVAKVFLPACNAIALGEFDITLIPAVERDADGIPTAWRIFKNGRNELYKNGEKYHLDFSGEVFDAIITHFRNKGNRIPLDSNHFLYRLAEHYGVSESKILKVLPDGQGTFGFGDLEKREDGLWVTNIDYVPLARNLMKDGTFRYFSPVIRGLSDGRFRVTSVTMENVPAMTNIASLAASENEDRNIANLAGLTSKMDVIAASAEGASSAIKEKSTQTQNKEKSMKNLLIAIAGLIGMDSIAMGENDEAPEGIVEKVNNVTTELKGLRVDKKTNDGFLKGLRDDLALGEDSGINAVQAGLKGIFQKAENHDNLKADVDALKLSAENDKKTKLIDQGKASGQLSEKMATEWAKDLDSVALGAFLKHAPVVVPTETINRGNLPKSDSISLSEEDKSAAKQLGISEEDMLKQKKEDAGIKSE